MIELIHLKIYTRDKLNKSKLYEAGVAFGKGEKKTPGFFKTTEKDHNLYIPIIPRKFTLYLYTTSSLVHY